jgi:SAM-dependent methyltransferase
VPEASAGTDDAARISVTNECFDARKPTDEAERTIRVHVAFRLRSPSMTRSTVFMSNPRSIMIASAAAAFLPFAHSTAWAAVAAVTRENSAEISRPDSSHTTGQPHQAAPAESQPEPLVGKAAVIADANAMSATVTTSAAKAFLSQAENLPEIPARTLYRNKTTRLWLSAAQAEALPAAEREPLEAREIDENFYYAGRYGSPIAYTRALEILGTLGFTGAAATGSIESDGRGNTGPAASYKRTRILDFGYGAIGQVRLFGLLGADTVGVDVDPMLPVLYGDSADQGAIGDNGGKVTLVNGRWPSEPDAKAKVGVGFDLIISKNTLKNGYIHPAEPVDKRMTIDLGVSDDQFVREMFDALKPGGWVMIYNLCPAFAKPGEQYIPWADGKSPFPREMLEKIGFDVLAFDVVDDIPAREMGRALRWDRGMDLETGLFCWYTVLRRPAK